MHPLLIEIPILGGLRIYTYGVLVALAFLIGILWTAREAKIAGVKPEIIMDLSFYIIVAALVGSRLLYILIDHRRYWESPLDVLKIWEGGLVFYGGLIGAIVTSFFYLRRKKMPFLLTADLFMPGLALAHAIGRLGCLAAGCCYGREAHGAFFSIIFPQTPFSLAPAGVPLFPSQLVESLVELLIFFILVTVRKRKRFPGQIFLVYLVLYSISRSVLEVFRGDSVRGFVVPHYLSTSQLISIMLIGVCLLIYRKLKQKPAEPSV